MRYRFKLAYDGTAYAGFQSQINAVAIQDVLEELLSTIFAEKIRITMASRTDAGVHALGQIFHLDSEKERDPSKLKYALNTQLPKDLHILSVDIVNQDFHARFSVKRKTYHYLINIGEYNVFLHNRAYQCRYNLDLAKMEAACQLFLGSHDFGSFNTASYQEYPNQIRTIFALTITQQENLLTVKITGDGFLRNMVRIIVGTLVDVGRGHKSLTEVKEMLDRPNKAVRRYNAPPEGLYLMNIEY